MQEEINYFRNANNKVIKIELYRNENILNSINGLNEEKKTERMRSKNGNDNVNKRRIFMVCDAFNSESCINVNPIEAKLKL